MQDETVSRALYDAMRMALKDIEAVLARHGCPPGATMTDWVDEQLTALAAATKPVDMLLFCPHCGRQHIDAIETGTTLSRSGLDTLTETEVVTWSNPPHRSHLCHHCGTIWRPADVATNGVATIGTRGKNDSTLFATKAAAQAGQRSHAPEGLRGFSPRGDFAVELRFHSCRLAQAYLHDIAAQIANNMSQETAQ